MVKNILIAVKNKQEDTKLKKILTSYGYQVTSIINDAYLVLRTLQSKSIDISLIDYDLQGLNGLRLAQLISEEQLGPVILLSQHYIDTGINPPNNLFGILVKPITEQQLLNTIKLAVVQYDNRKKIEKELQNVKDALESRKLIERAKGILMRKYNLNEDEAYKKIRKSSMEKRLPMKKIAEAIILLEEN